MRGGPPDVILQYFSGLAAMLIIIFSNSLLFATKLQIFLNIAIKVSVNALFIFILRKWRFGALNICQSIASLLIIK